MTTKKKTPYDRRFPMPTQQTRTEWDEYMRRADEVSYRILCNAQEHDLEKSLGPYDVAYGPHTDAN